MMEYHGNKGWKSIQTIEVLLHPAVKLREQIILYPFFLASSDWGEWGPMLGGSAQAYSSRGEGLKSLFDVSHTCHN